MSVAAYREFALKVALDPRHELHLLPKVPPKVRRVLDVGCHAGHILEALHLPDDCEVFGCDVNSEALELARQYLPRATFVPGRAEALPFEDSSFDFVFSRGVVTVVDIPKALQQFNRVLKPGARLWISLHRWKDCRFAMRDASPLRAVPFSAYVALNSALFHYTGKLVRYPLNRSRITSFQTEHGMRRELENAGFGSITFSSGTYLVVEAEKVRTVIESLKNSNW